MEREIKKRTILVELWDYVKTILITFVIVLVITNVLVVNALIPSESMEKTIMTGDRIIGNRLAYLFDDPKRYDIVIFRNPDDEKEYYIKRVIGLPGETVSIEDGKVYIDGTETPLEDSFIPEAMRGGFPTYEVPEGHYFLMGDNRNNSKDSRFWDNTYVAKGKILGKAAFRYFPSVKIIK